MKDSKTTTKYSIQTWMGVEIRMCRHKINGNHLNPAWEL